jgi:predicted Zn-ribbon and HTH transcriptional regulator
MLVLKKTVKQNKTCKIELADIFRKYQHILPYAGDDEWKVINAITSCRTEKLGWHVYKCDNCHYEETVYNSCRNRHCPKCQGLAKAKWILQRDSELLPVPYFHLVFTLPHAFNQLILKNKKHMYSLLFKSVSDTLKQVVANPDNLGAVCGFFSILHTWDQCLNLHPHIHCVVPGGGLSPDKLKWISSAKRFFVPVRKLSKVFRGKFLNHLEKMHTSDSLSFDGNISALKNYANFKALLKKSCKSDWVVYSKPPFKGPHWALRYLARYTHRIAISNSRITGIKDDKVLFTYLDRKHGNVKKLMLMDAVTFMQKFLLHVLPPKFVRIRYYGFLGNTVKKKNLALIRNLLGDTVKQTDEQEDVPSNWVELMIFLTGEDPTVCKKCGIGHMENITSIPGVSIRYG